MPNIEPKPSMSAEEFAEETAKSTPQQEAAPKQTPESLAIKFYEVELPSKGRVGYPDKVEYRDILVRDEKILASATDTNYPIILNKILKSLLNDLPWFDEMTLHDRDYLLLWIWANNYTPNKEIQVNCRSCNHTNDITVDLTKLDVSDLSEDYTHPFMVKMSDDSVVGVRLLTVADQEAAERYLKTQEANKKLKDEDKFDFETILVSMTIDTGTVTTIEQKLKWIQDNVKGKDMARIRYVHEHFKYGVKDIMDHTCTNCEEVFKFRIPFRPDWLRPTVQDDFEEMLRFNKTP